MNRIDRIVAILVGLTAALACLRAALELASSLVTAVLLGGIVYGVIRLWKSGTLSKFFPKTEAAPTEKK